MAEWRFYVYQLNDEAGVAQYVGKGSGGRLRGQQRKYGLVGHEVARFKREKDAYAYEIKRIAAKVAWAGESQRMANGR